MSRESKERRKAKRLMKLDSSSNVAVATKKQVPTTVEKIKKTDQFEYKSQIKLMDEPDLTPEQPVFVLKSGLNGGDKVKIIPIRFYSTKVGKPQTVIQGYLTKGIIKIGDKLRLFDEGNFTTQKFIFIESIKVNNLFVESVGFDPKNKEGKIIEIAILDNNHELFSFADLLHFNNRATRPVELLTK